MRIPSLDGLRALSILMVILGHCVGTVGFPSWLNGFGAYSLLGVRVFFVISGFLITSLLLEEHRRNGAISLRGFYWRRTRRIFPAFYVYVAIVAIAVQLPWRDIVHAVTYTTNYHDDPNRSWYVGHLWSLAVEEQFYLLWPAVLCWLGRVRAARVAVLAVLLAPVFRAAGHFLVSDRLVHEAFPTVMDAIATGCLLALWRPQIQQYGARIARHPLLLTVVLLAIAYPYPTPGFHYVVGYSLSNLIIALLVDRAIVQHESTVGRFLNTGPIVWIGTLSYSLYLWQQPFLDRHGTEWFKAFPINILLALACALASYYLVERPCLAPSTRVRMPRAAAGESAEGRRVQPL
jgi:peptidoglycan/LPS O-acetylase OafA/YrhL